MRSKPGATLFQIHSFNVAFRPRVRAADRCMGRKPARTQLTEQQLDDFFPPKLICLVNHDPTDLLAVM